MRNLVDGSVLKVHAIGGLHVVTLAWDFVGAQTAKKQNLLGFAIERAEYDKDQVIERYFLRGIKRFENKDEGIAAGTPVPTSEHPIRSRSNARRTMRLCDVLGPGTFNSDLLAKKTFGPAGPLANSFCQAPVCSNAHGGVPCPRTTSASLLALPTVPLSWTGRDAHRGGDFTKSHQGLNG
jgi:hypothetical protein